MKKTILSLFAIPFLTITGCHSSNSSLLLFKTVFNDAGSKNSSSEIEVKKGQDLSKTYCYSSMNTSNYFLGLYVNDSNQLVKASQIRSYDGSFTTLTCMMCKKTSEENYLNRFNGEYHNWKGDLLLVENNTISWSYSLDKENVIHLSASIAAPSANDKMDFAPFTYSFSVDEETITRNQNEDWPLIFEIANYDWFYDTVLNEYSWDRSILKNAILPAYNDMKDIINNYCLNHNLSYDEAVFDNKADYIYTANNNLTIDYDL